ncbi:hypothetical protein SteCoe_23363 [Stentor coeruleus]|uniref:Uncharacterized protein n=1 Tax=Stentor coeruleus TaxID=5963 RepID=A0A1R2BJZ2_9CILI|nr:hypothetical protein SteCoe_23363 [Stentor coeruleus]
MSNPLVAFKNKYFKIPDCWRGLLILGGVLIVDKYIMDYFINHHIFGDDGLGGDILVIKSRVDHHEAEFREARKKYYWHQKSGRYYLPGSMAINTKLDYKTLSYNNSHLDSWVDPKTIPSGHNPENNTFSFCAAENFNKE